MKTIIKSNYEELPRYVDVIIGQKYRHDKNEFLQEESFSGRLADVTIFREALTLNSIKLLANCDSISSRNLILDWFISSYQQKGKDMKSSYLLG